MRSMFGASTNLGVNSAAFMAQPGGPTAPGGPVPYPTPMPTDQAPVPKFDAPSLQPPDPSGGGFIL